MKQYKLLAIAAAVGLAAVADATAASIGVSFVGRNDAGAVLAPTDTAGVVPQANWWNVPGEPFTGLTPPLGDSAAAFTAVKLQFTASDSWSADSPALTPSSTGNDRMMKGIIKANPSSDTATEITDGTDRMIFTFTNLTAGNYDVIVYSINNGAGGQMSVNAGGTTYYIAQDNTFTGTFTQATSTDPNTYQSGVNYARFNGVAAAGDGTITITCVKKIVQPQVVDGIGVAGIQLVAAGSFPPNTAAPGISNAALPADVTVAVGANALFEVVPDGPWSVQWQKNGVNIPGATSKTYTVIGAQAGNNGEKYKAILSNNVNPPATSREATLLVDTPVYTPGFLAIAFYENISGTAVADLLNNDNFKNRVPSSTSYIPAFDTPNGHGENYGAEVYGWIVPTVTGDYWFYIRSDDASALYLNETGETLPNPRTGVNVYDTSPIAAETTCCRAFLLPDPAQAVYPTTGFSLFLEQGKKYGVVALLKEGTGGDYMQVAWSTSATTDPATLTPIPGANIASEALAAGRTVVVTTPPASTTAYEARTAKFTVEYTVTPAGAPVGFQWKKNGAPITGANAVSYTTPALTLGDSGNKYSVEISTLANVKTTSLEATLTVLPDTIPPLILGAGALASKSGSTFDVGVWYDEPVDAATAGVVGNYTLSAGSISAVTQYPKTPGVVLTASGLTVGNTYTVTVTGVKDLKGNTMPATPISFTVSNMKWGDVGANELGFPSGIVAVGPNAFDVYSGGIGQWGTYDEASFVYEQVTGDFDKNLRVSYQDNSSQWARAGLIARDVLNFGVNRATQDAGAAMRYQKVHVNPQFTAMGTAGNYSWEGNRRLTTGAATTSAGGGGTPAYPDAWCRIKRVGQHFVIYGSNGGSKWDYKGNTTFDPAMPDQLYVGPDYSPENGNVTDGLGLRGMWVAKMRDYGNFSTGTSMPKYGIGLNFGAQEANDTPDWRAMMPSNSVAGVTAVAQSLWNNLTNANSVPASPVQIIANNNGVGQATTMTVTWSCPNTWSTTGRGEENNAMTGPDADLMTGFLDTGNATTTKVNIGNIPAALTSTGYDVYIYMNGGVSGRGGGYRVFAADGTTGLTDWVDVVIMTNATTWVQAVPKAGEWVPGNYVLFSGLTAAAIQVQGSTENGHGFSGTPRAPINAIQLVPKSTTVTPTASLNAQGQVVFVGVLVSSTTVNGTYQAVPGATSPYTLPKTGTAMFYRSASQ